MEQVEASKNSAAFIYSPLASHIVTRTTSVQSTFQDGSIEVTREYPVEPSSNDVKAENPTAATTIDTTNTDVDILTSTHSLHYRIHNRMNLSSQKAAPILGKEYIKRLGLLLTFRILMFDKSPDK